MPNTTTSAEMNMPIPVVGTDPGPDWASNLNACLLILDQHNHTPGYGVPIVSDAININSDLPFNQYNLTLAKSLRFYPQGSPLAGGSDLGCLYESGVDLYYNDGNGNQVRITQSGGVAGSPGSIASLASPASATYVSATPAFVWQSAANTPANLDAGAVVFRNITANSYGCTVSCPAALGANYSLVLPPLPASQKIMTLDASGNITAPYVVDNSTIEVSSNTIRVKAGGLTTSQLSASAGILKSQMAALGQQISSSCGTFATATTGSDVDVTNLTVTITSSGRPIWVGLQTASNSGSGIYYDGLTTGGADITVTVKIYRDGVAITATAFRQAINTSATETGQSLTMPPGCIWYIDTPAAGTYVYKIAVRQNGAASTIGMIDCKLVAFEL